MKTFITATIIGGMTLLSMLSCQKKAGDDTAQPSPLPNSGFIKYTIKKDQQYCEQTTFKQTNYTELSFVVRFDNTAIYQTKDPSNQFDINKLFGFSDNNSEHHQFSARIGWRWSDNALRLFGYIYNNGVRKEEELCVINIGEEYTCSIKVTSSTYIFHVGNHSKTMPRNSTTATATGYQLYPYFGGDEKAPHDIHIWIKEI